MAAAKSRGKVPRSRGRSTRFQRPLTTFRAGARLVLSYESAGNAFTGKVENATSDKLDRVRGEVHLSNGIELGPTTPVDLAPGQTVEVRLQASSQPFVSWSATPRWGAVVAAAPNRLSM